jgi:hypothetical protein
MWKNPSEESVRNFFEYCKKPLKIEKQEDWYNISRNQIVALNGQSTSTLITIIIITIIIINIITGITTTMIRSFVVKFFLLFLGGPIMLRYKNLGNALSVAFPEFPWIQGRFKYCSNHIWKNPKNVREFLDYCKKELDVVLPEDWCRISNRQIHNLGGSHCYCRRARNS